MRVGIDFGTSNTSVAVKTPDGVKLLELEPGTTSIPTAIFYELSSRDYSIGNPALEDYEAGEDGRLMRSIKSVLGTSLIEETTQIGNRATPFRQVILDFLSQLMAKVEKTTGQKVTHVTQGRPVSFNDDDPSRDAMAQAVLADCLKETGVLEVEFLFEPVAAARSVRFGDDGERIAFVVDIGGGTSDFSVVRLTGGEDGFEVLGSSGVYVGGNDFDRILSFFELTPLFGRTETLELNGLPTPSAPYVTLSDWKSHNRLYLPAAAKEIAWMRKFGPSSKGIQALEYLVENFEAGLYAHKTEAAKIALSGADEAAFHYDADDIHLSKHLMRAAFEDLISETIATMHRVADACLAEAGVRKPDVTDIIMVGGSTFIPAVEDGFRAEFPQASLSANDRFGAVAKGLALHGG
ncbi:Hsp70 family protein [Ponticaulis profundi]|uniref:Hsp70 family protein n=1 Tax=Ponticaulis profundi TaxID=2665222 RepID=A0ABW1SBK1_9PROT